MTKQDTEFRIQDSELWIPTFDARILDTEFWILNSVRGNP